MRIRYALIVAAVAAAGVSGAALAQSDGSGVQVSTSPAEPVGAERAAPELPPTMVPRRDTPVVLDPLDRALGLGGADDDQRRKALQERVDNARTAGVDSPDALAIQRVEEKVGPLLDEFYQSLAKDVRFDKARIEWTNCMGGVASDPGELAIELERLSETADGNGATDPVAAARISELTDLSDACTQLAALSAEGPLKELQDAWLSKHAAVVEEYVAVMTG